MKKLRTDLIPDETKPEKEKATKPRRGLGDVNKILEQVRSEIKEKSGTLGPATEEDYNEAIEAFEARGILNPEEERVYQSLLEKREKLRKKKADAEKAKSELELDKEKLIESLKWRIEMLAAPGRRNEPKSNKEIAARMIDDIIKRLEELGVHVENPLKKDKVEEEKEIETPKKDKKITIRKLESGEEVLDVDPAKKALMNYSDLKKINEKIASVKSKLETFIELGKKDLADECQVLLADLEHFRDEVSSIKKEKQRAYRIMNTKKDNKMKNKMRARLDSLAERQRRLEDDKFTLIEMNKYLNKKLMLLLRNK